MMCMKRLLPVVGAAALLATSVAPAAAAGGGDPPLISRRAWTSSWAWYPVAPPPSPSAMGS